MMSRETTGSQKKAGKRPFPLKRKGRPCHFCENKVNHLDYKDLDLLRRDEIWFAEKDSEGASHLYSMVDFKVRKDLEIRKHYLQGRFGAVPFLGNLDRLRAETGRLG